MDQVFSSNVSILTSFKRKKFYHTIGRYKWGYPEIRKDCTAHRKKNCLRTPIHFRHSLMRLTPTLVTNDNSRSLLQLESFKYFSRNEKTNSGTGNWTPISTVRASCANHYTIPENLSLFSFASIWFSNLNCKRKNWSFSIISQRLNNCLLFVVACEELIFNRRESVTWDCMQVRVCYS